MAQMLPQIVSLRDAFAFREHVESSAEEVGREVVPQYYRYPVYYYGNHLNIYGPGSVPVGKPFLKQLDFELEVAVLIGKKGRNIPVSEADNYIQGFTIMNDFSARSIQWDEMKVKLGPHKGKDFATALGPHLVPMSELERYRKKTGYGSQWNLKMEAYLNGERVSEGNLGDMYFTFAQIIERASLGTTLFPNECIGSGTVGTGCLREYNYFQRKKNPEHQDVWLKPGDEVQLVVEGLGELTNVIGYSE